MTYKLVLDVSDEAMTDFFNMAYRDGTTPAEILEGFINDLVCSRNSNGSDERDFAERYYDRVGYGRMMPLTFCQWLLRDDSLSAVAEAMDDIQDFTEEIDYLKEHPDEADSGELEDLEAERQDSREQIEDYYKDYADEAEDPEALETGLQGVSAYLEALEAMKGGR